LSYTRLVCNGAGTALTQTMAPSRWRLLVALALGCGGAVSGCGGPSDVVCGVRQQCPDGKFCNDGECWTCHEEHGAAVCNCDLSSSGETECRTWCGRAPKTGTGGCCCGTFLGEPVQRATACAGAQMCADTDLACCAHVYNYDGVCNEHGNQQQCVPGNGTTGNQPSPGWDYVDCGDDGDGEGMGMWVAALIFAP
jgi:hypothetical protein